MKSSLQKLRLPGWPASRGRPGCCDAPGGFEPRLRVEAGGEDGVSGGSLTLHCSGKLRARLWFRLSCSAYLTKWLTCEQGK